MRLLVLITTLAVIMAATLANARAEEGVERYTIDTFSLNRDGQAGDLFNRTITVQNYTNLPVTQTNIVVEFTYTAQILYETSGVWEFTAYWNNQPICSWAIESLPATLEPRLTSPHYITHCHVEDVAFNNHTLRVTRSIAAGNPAAIQFESVSYKITQEDLLEPLMDTTTTFEAMTGLTGIEFGFIIALAFLGVMLWSRSTDVGIQFFGALIVVIAGLAHLSNSLLAGLGTLWAATVVFSGLLMILGAYMIIRWAISIKDGSPL